MEADCFSGSCPRIVSVGQKFSVAIERESPTTFVRKKCNFVASFHNSESRGNEIVILLIVGSHVHLDTKFRYLSNDSFSSSKTFIREDCRVGVSINKLNDSWKQLIFLVVVRKTFYQEWGFGSYRTSLQQRSFEKKKFRSSFHHFESRFRKTITLLIVGSFVNRDTKIR